MGIGDSTVDGALTHMWVRSEKRTVLTFKWELEASGFFVFFFLITWLRTHILTFPFSIGLLFPKLILHLFAGSTSSLFSVLHRYFSVCFQPRGPLSASSRHFESEWCKADKWALCPRSRWVYFHVHNQDSRFPSICLSKEPPGWKGRGIGWWKVSLSCVCVITYGYLCERWQLPLSQAKDSCLVCLELICGCWWQQRLSLELPVLVSFRSNSWLQVVSSSSVPCLSLWSFTHPGDHFCHARDGWDECFLLSDFSPVWRDKSPCPLLIYGAVLKMKGH